MTDSGKKILIVVRSHQDWSEAGRKSTKRVAQEVVALLGGAQR